MAVIDILLVGKTPLGSSVRGVAVTMLLVLFWTFLLNGRWSLFVVSLITALAVVVAAHLFSKRDNRIADPGSPEI